MFLQGPTLLHRAYDVTPNSRQSTIAGETGSEGNGKEQEKPAAEKYHPRSILFSGPPQVISIIRAVFN